MTKTLPEVTPLQLYILNRCIENGGVMATEEAGKWAEDFKKGDTVEASRKRAKETGADELTKLRVHSSMRIQRDA